MDPTAPIWSSTGISTPASAAARRCTSSTAAASPPKAGRRSTRRSRKATRCTSASSHAISSSSTAGPPPATSPRQGLGPIEGVVDYVTAEFLGVRTSTGLYRFIHGLGGSVVVEHHDFAPATDEP